MSRIGKRSISIPAGVECQLRRDVLMIAGNRRERIFSIPKGLAVVINDGCLKVILEDSEKRFRRSWGTFQSILKSFLAGFVKPFSVSLELKGVGYRASVDKKVVNFQLGYSHPLVFSIPEGIEIVCEKPTLIVVSGVDLQVVGQVAASICTLRKPEPYKQAGIHRLGMPRLIKVGKKK